MSAKIISSLLLIGLCLAPSGTFPPQNPELGAAFDAYFTEMEKEGFSGIIYVEDRGKVLLHKAYGMASREDNRPMSVETGFDMGSIQKWLTQIGIYQLEHQGKLNLDDPLSKFFKQVPDDKADITIKQVLKHKAGFIDYLGGDYEVIDQEEALKMLFSAPLLYKPGSRRKYSNGGYSLLGILIEKLSDKSYEQFIYDEFLEPAGMLQTGYMKGGWEPSKLVTGYRADGSRWGTSLDHPWAEDGPSWSLRANGGMLTTVMDLRKLIAAFEEGSPLGEEKRKRLLDKTVQGILGQKIIGQAGSNGIFFADMEWNLNRKSGIIGMSSIENFSVERLILDNKRGKKLYKKLVF